MKRVTLMIWPLFHKKRPSVLGVLKHLAGIDFTQLKSRKIREGHYERGLPIVVDKITDTGPFLFDEYEFLKLHTQGIAKMNVLLRQIRSWNP